MLAQFALIVFAMLAVLALVVDVGMVRLTQAQMQIAADAAALEGLRYRDVSVVDPATGQPAANPFASDCLRRAAAHRVARAVFDDDHDPTIEDPAHAFGAGPVIDLTEGETSVHALQTMSVPDPRVYEPYLQLNQQNAVEGDMVSGRFCYNADPAVSESAGYALPGMMVCTEEQRGFGPYARNDFNPSAAAPQPPAELPTCPSPDDPTPSWPRSSGSLSGADDSAFLVRLRRSGELRDFPGQTEPDVSSSGPALPLLFGRGAPIHGDNPESDYSVRRDGLTVRATAIAEVRPAMHVGLPQSNPAQPGVTPFALIDTFVASLAATPTPVTIDPGTGVICRGATCTGGPNQLAAIGRFVDNLTDPQRTRWLTISMVGRALPAPVALACPAAAPGSGFGPVYSLMSAGGNRIIGFVRINWNRDPARPTNPCAVVVSRGASLVATSNATATLSGGLPLPPATPSAVMRELVDKHLEQNGRIAYGPLLAPALAR